MPRRLMSDKDLVGLPLDHRMGFVLAHIDGGTDIRTLTDVCGMTLEDVADVIERLVQLGVIKLGAAIRLPR